ncbi:MAG: hypothetical protein V4502_00495 [Pseudomonadota bacterium]
MKKMLLAVALTIALPGAAFAQAAPATAQHSMGDMQGMKMDGMNMQGMNMQKMSCKDMQAMMAKGHSMHMSKADMAKMCPESAKAAPKDSNAGAHQGHSGH